MKRLKRYLCLLYASLSLLACSVAIKPSTQIDIHDKQGKQYTGYILMGFDTLSHIEAVHIDGVINLTYEPDSAQLDNQFVLAQVPIGSYTFTQVETGIKKYELNDELKWDFDVSPGRINYIGNLEIQEHLMLGYYQKNVVELVNKSSFAIQYLQATKPSLLKNIKLVYQGPGNDTFIDYVQNQFYLNASLAMPNNASARSSAEVLNNE
ncbi:hypothetical protein [Catenovulum adriaticum]|uniref:DUF2846 domain-containing protein n=1 Tax=Catenovulum adriaticum TaxID=2984846 RepID=A0ABY7ASC5_9ALTE|nr:hypothetical protein [Catenovulum sp. TS8]WAJ72434.1 hypothetical protein OLW01_17035 [Catenovulum sp. TS8]